LLLYDFELFIISFYYIFCFCFYF